MIKNKKQANKTLLKGKAKNGFFLYVTFVLVVTFIMGFSVTVFAAGDPLQTVNNLSEFIFGIIRAIGLILLGFGIVQIGLSLKSHDPSQRANGFLTLAGGVIITFSKEILSYLLKKTNGIILINKKLDCSKV